VLLGHKPHFAFCVLSLHGKSTTDLLRYIV